MTTPPTVRVLVPDGYTATAPAASSCSFSALLQLVLDTTRRCACQRTLINTPSSAELRPSHACMLRAPQVCRAAAGRVPATAKRQATCGTPPSPLTRACFGFVWSVLSFVCSVSCLSLRVRLHVHTYTYLYILIHTYTYLYAYIYILIHTHTYIHILTCLSDAADSLPYMHSLHVRLVCTP